MPDFELFRVFQNGMVLQRDSNVNIWGFAKPGTEIKVKLDDAEYNTVTNSEGEFELSVYTGVAGGPHMMTVYNDSGSVSVEDILYGDVYIISGQSNMQLPVERTIDLIGERLPSINYPMIREFRVPEIMKFGETVKQLPECRWYKAVSADIRLMSATGFNFAENVYLREDVPIGLINNSIGGTPIESHLPEELLRRIGGYDAVMDECLDDEYVKKTIDDDITRMNDWYTRLYQADNFIYATEDYDDSGWKEIDIPVFFGDTEIDEYHGSIWFRKEINIPDNYNLNGVMLRLGTLIDGDEAYINGVKVGETAYMYPPRRYPVDCGLLRAGRNVIAIRLIINRNTGGFTYNKKYCLQGSSYVYEGGYADDAILSEFAVPNDTKCKSGMESPEDGRWEIDISGKWKYAYGAQMEELPMQTFFIYKPSALYNGMMHPVKKYTCRAGLWYQGESNDTSPYGYSKLMEALIDCWREWFGEDFPFMYVGLPQYDDPARVVKKDAWAVIREEQRRVLHSRANTAMAVTIDVGEANDLHPQTKEAVGRRLALAAEAFVYGRDIEYSGPDISEAIYIGEKNVIRLVFDHCKGGLRIINDNNYFEIGMISENDRTDNIYDKVIEWNPAGNVTITGDNTVEIELKKKAGYNPIAIRYCHCNCPAKPPLYNGEELPAIPFAVML